jgi:hypothetical protein
MDTGMMIDKAAAHAGDERTRVMRGKVIFIAGVGVGYVLGTRAGREKFDQMVAQARKFWESPTVQEAAGVVQAQANKLYDDGKQVLSDQVHKIGRRNGKSLEEGSDADKEEAWDTAVRRSQFPANSF